MDLDEILIEEVRKHKLLYDLSMEEYKNLRFRDRAWREVARSINFDEAQCKKRWKGLRDCYKRCKRMEVLASGSAAAAPRKQWKYYNAMSFLDYIMNARRTVSSMAEENVVEVDLGHQAIFDNGEEVELDSSVCDDISSETPSTSKRRSKEKEHTQFSDFLDTAGASIRETCTAFTERNARKNDEREPTALFFEALALEIKRCNFLLLALNRLHQKVSALVYDEIEKFHQR